MNYLTNASLIASLLSLSAFGSSPHGAKTIERFESIDPKSLRAMESTVKITSTPDAGHRTVLELTADFAKPGAATALVKTFRAGSLSAKHHTAIRLSLKSVTNTEVTVMLEGNYTRPDGRPVRFYYAPTKNTEFWRSSIQCSENWTEVTIPFSDLKRAGRREWKDNAQVVVPGGDPIEPWEIDRLSKIVFSLNVETRGTSTVARILFDDLVALEK